MFNLDPLGAAAVALILGWGGVQLLSNLLHLVADAGMGWLRVKIAPHSDKKDAE
jgi:hypothetical protein